ncbi:NACHT domain-containing NTPase [Allocoleopsis sp.]|uniref:NACHT domain-containing protein n=1 Tax=Allocoleopsis sp. TaxID=3088169 RepID=UPI002FCE8EFD
MARRSLQASPEGIKKAKQAFLRKGWTQEYLAAEVGLETRQPIWKFFSGKPIARNVFSEICFRLDLNFEEIAAIPPDVESEVDPKIQESQSELDVLVTKVRQERYDQIQDQCGTLRLLDIARPVEIEDLYVDVNILEEITSQRWIEISDLQGFQPEEFDRLNLGKVRAEGVAGLKAVERYTKLMVLGKPGAGKTTFLQYLAVQCNQGHFQAHLIPVFIVLKNFAEDALDEGDISLLDYINQDFYRSEVAEQEVETLLSQGRLLILLDGLDEVPEAASNEVIKHIRKLSDKYYKNQLVITCRIAAQEYRFRGFTEVEIADFKPLQIEAFAKKWFVAVARNSPKSGLQKASLFLEQLALPENQQIRELATTPVLLNLSCLVFQAKADFPLRRSDLYKQGLDLLLIRWDEARGIKRDEIYRNLSLPHKLQLLSQLAAISFSKGEYFFEENTLQHLIADYLRTLLPAQIDESALELDSAVVLKAIEAQHGLLVERARGIYSFSHLTFQEYFTARAIVAGTHLSLQQLVRHLTEKRWREVYLLTAQMLLDADELLQLMKQQVDALVSAPQILVSTVLATERSERLEPTGASAANLAPDSLTARETLQLLLNWVMQKSLEVKTPYKPAAVRAFYLTLALPTEHRLARDQALALAIDRSIANEVEGELALDLALIHALAVTQTLTLDLIHNRLTALHLALDLDHLIRTKPISDLLRQLKNQLPNPEQDLESLKQWWKLNGQSWASQLRTLMIEQRNIGHEWHLSEAAQLLLEQYNNANKLLVECLKSTSQMTPKVQQEIEEKLLLPMYQL